MLWDNIISKLFGMTYKDAFDAAEKLRKWSIDLSKPIQHDIHNLMLLLKRANETAKTILSEKSMLRMMYDAISKDPREGKNAGILVNFLKISIEDTNSTFV